MPFTFSHPAIVLPFYNAKKINLSFTGLVIGSVIPDIEFLLRLRNTENIGHTWWGVFLLDLPFAIPLCFVFHNLIRNTLIEHLPDFFRSRFAEFASFNWKNYFNQNRLRVLISILIGIATHFFLDACTHKNGTIARTHIFFYKEIDILQYHVPMYFVLQVGFSIVGALYMLWFITLMKKGSSMERSKTNRGYWLTLISSAMIILAARFIIDTKHTSSDDIIIAITGSFVYGLVIASFYYSKKYLNIKKSPDL